MFLGGMTPDFSLPHVGMRKVKSLLAILIGFLVWQGIRLFFPDLEAHPVFIYFYGLLEIRDSSDKTMSFGKLRIKSTFIALGVGLPALMLRLYFHEIVTMEWLLLTLDLLLLLAGVLLSLELGQRFGCDSMTGLTAIIYISLLIYHADEQRYVYALLRGSQTIIGVLVAWLVNVVLLPYPRRKKDN